MDDCQRCGNRLPWDSGITILIGGTHALLCVDCKNAWHAYFLTLPAYTEKIQLDARDEWLKGRALAGDAPTAEEWMQRQTEVEAWQAKMLTIGQMWLATPVAVPVEEPNG